MTVAVEHLNKAADETIERAIAATYEAVKKAADISRQATGTLCEKGEQMKHLIERFLENCRTYVHDKPVTHLGIAVALGRQEAGRDKVASFMTGKLMRPQQSPVGKPESQVKTPTLLEEALNLVTLAQTVSSAWSWVPPITLNRPRRPMPGGKASCL